MSKSCKGMLDDYLACVEQSPCVQKQKFSLTSCAKGTDGASVPEACAVKRANYFSCRKGQLDMRSRLRGNKGY